MKLFLVKLVTKTTTFVTISCRCFCRALLTSSSSKRRTSSSRGGRKRRRRRFSRRDHRRRQTTRHLSSIYLSKACIYWEKIVSLSKKRSSSSRDFFIYTQRCSKREREEERERRGCTPHYKVQYNERCDVVFFFNTLARGSLFYLCGTMRVLSLER